MAEFIEREKALEECDWYANEFCECEYAIMPLKGALENLPAADVRPVVLCRDCRSYNKPRLGFCETHLMRMHRDDYCSYGKKREES